MSSTPIPLHGYILVKELKEKKTDSGLVLSVGEENPRLTGGVVVAQAGDIAEMVVGKYVLYGQGNGEKVYVDNVPHRLVRWEGVMAWRDVEEGEDA